MRRERLVLEDIVSAADAISEFIAPHTLETFERTRLVESAVVRELILIGDPVGLLSDELRDRHPEVPWPQIRGLRNAVVHHYFGTDWEEVWRTATEDLPRLRAQIVGIIRTEFPEPE
jgi:uncharacterized protein with HEPN domain